MMKNAAIVSLSLWCLLLRHIRVYSDKVSAWYMSIRRNACPLPTESSTGSRLRVDAEKRDFGRRLLI